MVLCTAQLTERTVTNPLPTSLFQRPERHQVLQPAVTELPTTNGPSSMVRWTSGHGRTFWTARESTHGRRSWREGISFHGNWWRQLGEQKQPERGTSGAPVCPELPEPPACPELPEPPACPELPEPTACPELPEPQPLSPEAPLSPVTPSTRVFSPGPAARVGQY
ncbi:uncharacterized protein LOC135563825 isoform X1 [Oncorhynchus nerka]|uniref:uncharacterized protein LOC135563825 isoform X1 n=1 Tax=Oncorhynchus nerka TaxID=8023 RepID=UPI0031B7F734